MQYISACRRRIRILFHRCTMKYGYFSFPFCFFDHNDSLCQQLYRLKRNWTRQNTNISGCSVPGLNMDRSEIKPHDVSERFSRMWVNHCRSQEAAGYIIQKNKHLNMIQTHIAVFILQTSDSTLGGFHKVLVIFRGLHMSTKMQKKINMNYKCTFSEEHLNGGFMWNAMHIFKFSNCT